MHKGYLFVLQAAAFLAICIPAGLAIFAPAKAEGAAQALLVSDAWVRAMPPGRPMTAAYLRIENPGSDPIRVSAVSASVGEASLHETRVEGGQSRMRELEGITVAPGTVVELEPGGMHIMLMGLKTTPAVGDTLNICLTAGDEEICAEAPVLRGKPATMDHSHHQGGE